jgi:hypothetical protein
MDRDGKEMMEKAMVVFMLRGPVTGLSGRVFSFFFQAR